TLVIRRRWHCTESRRRSRVLRLEWQEPLRASRKRRKKWWSLSPIWCVSCRIGDAFAANATDRLQTLLLGVVVALRCAVIVHDGAPRQTLRTSDISERQK